jgi:hypothetical protein
MVGDLVLQVTEQDRDRHTRVATIDLNKKIVRTPCFVTQIQNKYEFDIFFGLKEKYAPTRLDAFVVKYPDVPSVLRRVQPAITNDILGKVREDKYTLFMKNNLFIIDPATDYLYYTMNLDSFSLNHNTPKCIIDYASKLRTEKKDKDPKVSFDKRKERLHKEFWKERVSNNSEKMSFVKGILEYQRRSRADILLPPAPLIDSEEMLKIAIEINNVAKGIARINNKLCATYLNVKTTLLKSDELMNKIKLAVYENSSKSLTVFKFKNLDLALPNSVIQRENYRQLMTDLAYYSQDYKDRACMVLENSCQCFVSPFAGFDFVSSSFTFYDRDMSYSEHPPFGSYFDPIAMIHVPFDEVARSYDELGRLKCPCQSCKDVKVTDLRLLKPEQWNEIRRTHVPMYMNHFMETILKAVRERNTELARDTFSNSKVSNLKDVLP